MIEEFGERRITKWYQQREIRRWKSASHDGIMAEYFTTDNLLKTK